LAIAATAYLAASDPTKGARKVFQRRVKKQGALFKTLLSEATTRLSERLSKSHDTPQKVIKEQRLSWKN
jgi:hypothetical protein